MRFPMSISQNYTSQAATPHNPDSAVGEINHKLSSILDFHMRLNSVLTGHVESILGHHDQTGSRAIGSEQPREVPSSTAAFVRVLNEETIRTTDLLARLGLTL